MQTDRLENFPFKNFSYEREREKEGGVDEMEMEEEKKRRKRKSSSLSLSWSTESSSSSINNLDDGCLMHIFSFLSPIPGMLPLLFLSFFLFFKTLFAFPLPLLGFKTLTFGF